MVCGASPVPSPGATGRAGHVGKKDLHGCLFSWLQYEMVGWIGVRESIYSAG